MGRWEYARAEENRGDVFGSWVVFGLDQGPQLVPTWRDRFRDSFEPKGSSSTKIRLQESLLTMLSWLGQDGWEVVGFAAPNQGSMSGTGAAYQVCLLKRGHP